MMRAPEADSRIRTGRALRRAGTGTRRGATVSPSGTWAKNPGVGENGRDLKLRGYREEDRGAEARLAAGALGGSVEGWEERYTPEKNPRLDPEQVYVIEEDGEIRATTAVLPLEIFVDGKPAAMGGGLQTWQPTRPTGDGAMRGSLCAPRLRVCGSGAHVSPCFIPLPTPSTAATAGSLLPRQ